MYPAVLTIVLVGIVLGVGLYVLSTFHDNVTPDRSGSQTLINCSTATTLTDSSLAQFALSTIDTAAYTNGTAITNYTVTSAGVITWGADLDAQCTAANSTTAVTYTYTYDEANTAAEAVTTTVSGLADFATWIAIIVVVIAAAIVLGIVLTSFGRRRNSI